MAGNCGVPVYFSKYLADGKIDEARKASKVSLPHSSVNIDSWAGYVTVNASRGDHLFVWYFPKEQTTKGGDNEPLLVWLNGGPGYSSLLGLFEEIGPLAVDENNKVSKRAVSWTDKFSLLFIDNPVGVGFSYRESSDYNQFMDGSDITDNLYECLKQFIEVFPQVKTQDIYIGGQSYGGKYVPSFAYKLHTAPNPNIKMRGMYIASGLMSPLKMLPGVPDLLTTLGVISKQSGQEMRSSICENVKKMKTSPKAAINDLLDAIFGFMGKVKGYPCMDNVIATQDYNWRFESYVNLPEVQAAIHAKPTPFKVMNDDTMSQMAPDFLTGMSRQLSTLIDNKYKVLLFNGQMDPVVSVAMTDTFLSDLRWSGSGQFAKSEKKLWKDTSGNTDAYVTTVNNFSWVIIPRAGHRTAIDQPQQVLNMMVNFIEDKPF